MDRTLTTPATDLSRDPQTEGLPETEALGVKPPLEVQPWRIVDARGHRCPTPTLRLRRTLESAPAGAVVQLLADDPMARIDVAHFATQAGCTLTAIALDEGVLSFSVRKPA